MNTQWISFTSGRGGEGFFKVEGRGGEAFLKLSGGGGEGFLKPEKIIPEEDFSSSIAWSLRQQ